MNLTVQSLIETQQGRTDLSWLAGQSGQHRLVGNPDTSVEDQVGYMNMMHAERIGVLGPREINYYRQISESHRQKVHEALVAAKPPALIVAEAQVVPQPLIDFCNEAQLPLLISPLTPGPLIESLKQFLGQKTKDHTSLHGVLMDVLGMGVLITGDSGLGKSELALELISRGHGLVADDVVDIERVNHHTIVGRCPTLLQGLLEVRGLGLIDIRTIFGESAVRRHISIKLIVHLVRRSTLEHRYERLPLEALTETVLGIPVRKVAIPVAAGRNIAVLTETAVRATVLALRGIDTTREFVKRQQAAIMESLTAEGNAGNMTPPDASPPPPPR
ncbi:MAG: HPr(Ser) kinase/phosphatase [Lautropia sp.]|nr:HPr(Ser) kinase/phosphatase [Lautropia sp.]